VERVETDGPVDEVGRQVRLDERVVVLVQRVEVGVYQFVSAFDVHADGWYGDRYKDISGRKRYAGTLSSLGPVDGRSVLGGTKVEVRYRDQTPRGLNGAPGRERERGVTARGTRKAPPVS
jgi:hypothetical protein